MIFRKDPRLKSSLLSWTDYVRFFFLIGGSITASFYLFFKFGDISLYDIHLSAFLTFGNVLFITFLSTVIYGIWRYFNISRPVEKILNGTDRIKEGEFGGQIARTHKNLNKVNEFDVIIDNLNLMSKELQGIETLRTDFISNVSHEIKSPLSSIQTYATLLQDNTLSDEDRKEYTRAITDAAGHLSDLITNILKLNKLENQEIFPDQKHYDLSEQLIQSILLFEGMIEEKNIYLQTNIEEGAGITADEELMAIVWNNLISNALKFTPENGTVCISLERDSGKTKVSIADDGIGMDDETQKHIFDKFYQGDSSHSTKGNGLGLALVKRILDVEKMNIQVHSSRGKGSTFTVIIPG